MVMAWQVTENEELTGFSQNQGGTLRELQRLSKPEVFEPRSHAET